MRSLKLAAAAVTATILLTGCGGDQATDSAAGTGAAAANAAGTFNDADVAFAQHMIPHHRQAVQMAALVEKRAATGEVKDLARWIQSAQQPEIDTMNGWLTTWGHTPPAPTDHAAMAGMATGADLAALEAASGAAFDKKFLTLMIKHHEAAVTTAQQEVDAGWDATARTLAQKIVTDQQAEITTMKGLLAKL
ncbi:hypothetical protein Aca07nite_04470 [Actinoplanes capillaceus]|uniref:DUF305 domain-containing protein n=1 Tax=Actinoplanes campanulatus TaxID=113559 RepID=A0ABQ3WAX8_9ACTN|nr:DUF305 domain-containing protein [Actinoplanes capillaceus]GID43172.1 hypothetical protein Aca07nite_04470 [Actinoplanes capillaceus]